MEIEKRLDLIEERLEMILAYIKGRDDVALSSKEAGIILGVSEATIHRRIHSGKLTRKLINGKFGLSLNELKAIK